MSWAEAWDLTLPCLRDPDSHLTAALLGWSYVPGAVQRVVTDTFEAYVNANRGKHTTPWKAPRPWTKAAPAAPGHASEEDRAQRSRLNELLFGGADETAGLLASEGEVTDTD